MASNITDIDFEYSTQAQSSAPPVVILSIDVEEHFRIESAAGVAVALDLKNVYRARMRDATRWILDELARHEARATFFVLGEVARDDPALVRAIQRAGHEVASHGWDHRRLHTLTPDQFREDARASKEALEAVTGEAVVGYRAPTFSLVRRTAWAVDVLAEVGYLYDSSVYPVRHDRYGVPDAPRSPYVLDGAQRSLLELPPMTWRLPGLNLPAAGGGSFRLFPLWVMERAIRQNLREGRPPAAMLYVHPWEFDPDQPRLPLCALNTFRTYVGIGRSRGRLATLLAGGRTFAVAKAVARRILDEKQPLERFRLASTLPS